MREKYESLSLAVLRESAKARGMRGISALKKGDLIEAMLLQDQKDQGAARAGQESGTEQKAAERRPERSGGTAAEQKPGRNGVSAAEQKPEKNGVSAVEQKPERSGGAAAEQPDEGIRESGVSFEPEPEGAAQDNGEQHTSQERREQPSGEYQTRRVYQTRNQNTSRAPRPGNQGGGTYSNRNSYNNRTQNSASYNNRSQNTPQGQESQNARTGYGSRFQSGIQGQEPQGTRAGYGSRSQSGIQGQEPQGARASYGSRSQNTAQGQESQGTRAGYGSRSQNTAQGQESQGTRAGYGSRSQNGTQSQESQGTRTSYGSRSQNGVQGQEPQGGRTIFSNRSQSGAQEPQASRPPYNNRPQNQEQPVSACQYGDSQPVSEAQEGMDSPELRGDKPPVDLAQLDSGIQVSGILEVMPDGYGFIRSDNYLPGENDVYVSPSQIRRFNLKTGDIISGNTRIKSQQEKFSALLYLKTINDRIPSEAMKRYNFEDMTPIFPNERMRMERASRALAMRIVDLFSPIGKGQRGMIVSPPKAGKTTLLKDVARSILQNDPDMKLLILLIDERPEEVTDIKEAIQGENVEVIYSTFDELPEHHKRVSEMVIERAKRLVEHQENVTILLDSITRLARAYNLTVPPSGRTLSGGLDPAALHMPKRFFGAARKMREGGSLTILATALVDTGSKMDDVVYEEFKGTGNMELVLDRKLSEKRVFPAIDIPKSGTRREDLLLDREEQEAVYIMRRALNGMKSDEAVENTLNMFVHTKDNRELVQRVRRQKFI